MVVLGDEILAALGPEVRARTVGVSTLADDPRYSPSVGAWPREVPRLTKNPEMAIALAPSVLVVATFTDAEYRSAVASVVPTVVELRDFTGFEGYLDNVMRVGVAVGAVDRARSLQDAFLARVAVVQAQQPSRDAPPTCLSWGHGSTAGAETTFDAAAQAAGCINVAATAGLAGHRRVDAEQVVAWDPDYIVLSCRDEGEAHCDLARAEFEAQPGFAELRAVRHGQLILIPPPFLSSTGVGMVTLAELIQAGLRREPASVRGITAAADPRPHAFGGEELRCAHP